MFGERESYGPWTDRLTNKHCRTNKALDHTEKDPLQVIVVCMEVVPYERLALDNRLDVLQMFDRNDGRHDFWTGPHDLDTTEQLLPDHRQILAVIQIERLLDHVEAILGRTEEKEIRFVQVLVQFVGQVGLGVGKRLELRLVDLLHLVVNVVEQYGKVLAPEFPNLLQFSFGLEVCKSLGTPLWSTRGAD
jgi:hypothetical protein